MATGKVKWFNNAKGYGFILPEEGGEDLFAHYSSIQMEGYKTLKAGQEVEFEVQEGPKGYHAVNIRGEAGDAVEDQAESDVETDAQVDVQMDTEQDEQSDEQIDTPTDTPEAASDADSVPADGEQPAPATSSEVAS